MRYVVEGLWSRHIVHREVIKNDRFAAKIKAAGYIRFTDGTCLYLKVRECDLHERVKSMHVYSALIDQCVRYGIWDVAALQKHADEAQKVLKAVVEEAI